MNLETEIERLLSEGGGVAASSENPAEPEAEEKKTGDVGKPKDEAALKAFIDEGLKAEFGGAI